MNSSDSNNNNNQPNNNNNNVPYQQLPGLPLKQQNDISLYSNSNQPLAQQQQQPRLSGDWNVAPFLNFPNDNPSQQRFSVTQDMNQFGRGYSIVNSMFQPPFSSQQQTPYFRQPSQGQVILTDPTTSNNNSTNTKISTNGNNVPKLRNPSFANSSGNIIYTQQYPLPPDTKRNSSTVFFVPNDPTINEFDIYSNRKDSMKPPTITPINNNNNYNNTANRLSNSSSEFDTFFQQPQQQQTNSLFSNNSNSRNGSLKFNPDDFNFQFRSRKSSLRDSIDSNPKSIPKDEQLNIDSLNKKINLSMTQSPSSTTTNVSKNQNINEESSNNSKHDDSEHEQEDKLKLVGSTKVDQLMLMIQARKKGVKEKIKTKSNGELLIEENSKLLPPENELVGGIEKPKPTGSSTLTSPINMSAEMKSPVSSPTGSNNSSIGSNISTLSSLTQTKTKKYECKFCHRFFSQPTHLEVHIRSHVGHKPFKCKYCGRHFTQGGNLRTHQRLHTGEKPYSCDICFKKFSRKGNLAAHLLTHQNIKPFICRLDNCDKGFTQLGNMKAHQNRFHLQTLLELTKRLATVETDLNSVPEEEKRLLNYFTSIYKNSNKGIKGRGKGSTKIVPNDEFSTNLTTSNHHNNNASDSRHRNYTTAPSQLHNGKRPNDNSNNTPKPQQNQDNIAATNVTVGNVLQLTNNDNDNNTLINNYQLPTIVESQNDDNKYLKGNVNNDNNNIQDSINNATLLDDQNEKFDVQGAQNSYNMHQQPQHEQVRFKKINY